MTHLPTASSAGLDGLGDAARLLMPQHEFQDALNHVTSGTIEAGLTLQAALDQPEGALRQAAEHALDLLDGVVRQARTAAFAEYGSSPHGLADTEVPGAVARPGTGLAIQGSGEDAPGLFEQVTTAARESRAQSRQVLTRTYEVAALSAVTEDRVAANMGRLAARYPHCSAHLRALSRAAASNATRMRRWAEDHAATG